MKSTFEKSQLMNSLQGANQLCGAIKPGMSLTETRALSARYEGSLAVLSYDFAVASKSFCRCGINIEDQKVTSDEHKAWCLN